MVINLFLDKVADVLRKRLGAVQVIEPGQGGDGVPLQQTGEEHQVHLLILDKLHPRLGIQVFVQPAAFEETPGGVERGVLLVGGAGVPVDVHLGSKGPGERQPVQALQDARVKDPFLGGRCHPPPPGARPLSAEFTRRS